MAEGRQWDSNTLFYVEKYPRNTFNSVYLLDFGYNVAFFKKKTFYFEIIRDAEEVAKKCTGKSHGDFHQLPNSNILHNHSTVSKPIVTF